MAKIFISYRRADSKDFCARVNDRLVDEFGKNNVFFDVDKNIPSGSNWKAVLGSSLKDSDVLLVIIGHEWERIINERRHGVDFVRFEVKHGLKRDDMLVIPVLIDDTPIPGILPGSIQSLTKKQVFKLPRDPFFNAGIEQLVKDIRKWRLGISPRMITGISSIFLVIVLSLAGQLLGYFSGDSENPTNSAVLETIIESPTAEYTATHTDAPLIATDLMSTAMSFESVQTQVQINSSSLTNVADFASTADTLVLTEDFGTSVISTVTQLYIDSWTSTPSPTITDTPFSTNTALLIATTLYAPPTQIPRTEVPVDRCGLLFGRRTLYSLGQNVVVASESLRLRRDYDESGAVNALAQIYRNTQIELIGGPVCHNLNWYWQVQYRGSTGWIREAESGNPYICPLTNINCRE